jgi:hypothetical protein
MVAELGVDNIVYVDGEVRPITDVMLPEVPLILDRNDTAQYFKAPLDNWVLGLFSLWIMAIRSILLE